MIKRAADQKHGSGAGNQLYLPSPWSSALTTISWYFTRTISVMAQKMILIAPNTSSSDGGAAVTLTA